MLIQMMEYVGKWREGTNVPKDHQKWFSFSWQNQQNTFPFQETPGVTGKFGLGIRNEAGQRLIEFCQEIAVVITNTLFQQHKRRVYTWTSPDGQHRNCYNRT